MIDLWIGRHTRTNRIAFLGSATFGANQNRIALIVVFDIQANLQGTDGVQWWRAGVARDIPSYTTTSSNDVPPTPSTGTISLSSANSMGDTVIIKTSDYGQRVLDGGSVATLGAVGTVFEVVPDTVLAEYLNQLEYAQGFPYTNILPPSVKHG